MNIGELENLERLFKERFEHQKKFWMLSFVPWLLIILLMGYAFIQRDRRYKSSLDIARVNSYLDGRLMVYSEAMELGYGSWDLDKVGESAFKWREGLSSYTEWESQLVEAELTKGIPLGSYPDLKGFNLRRAILRSCTESIDRIFDGLETYERVSRANNLQN